MSLLEFGLLLIIAGVCGSIAQSLSGYSHGGCLATVALGFIGALAGTWAARLLQLPELFPVVVGSTSFPIIWSIIGGSVFAGVLGALAGRHRKRQ